MKKVMKTIMMLFVASGLVLTSCGEDEDVKDVELTMIPSTGTGTHFVQDTLKLTINGKGNSDNKLKTFTVTKAITGSATTTIVNQKITTGTDFVYNFADTFEMSEVGTITYTFKLEGEKGVAQTKTYVANVKEIKFIDVTTTDVSLFAQQYDGPNFMNLRTFETYGKDATTEQLENMDLASFFGTTNKYTLTSPSDAQMQGLYSGLSSFWTTDKERVTGLYKATGQVNFNTIAASGIDKDLVIFAEGKTYSSSINMLAVNDVILFKTQDNKLGLIKINGLSPANPQSDNARFDFLVLIQK